MTREEAERYIGRNAKFVLHQHQGRFLAETDDGWCFGMYSTYEPDDGNVSLISASENLTHRMDWVEKGCFFKRSGAILGLLREIIRHENGKWFPETVRMAKEAIEYLE
jgi:hypothetical protein